jgi:hypothetical protein
MKMLVPISTIHRLFLVLLFGLTGFVHGAEVVDTDICVYGGTSGGAIAAVQAARLGKSVSLGVFDRDIGGLTTGGLGYTDVGNVNSIGGLAREFYQRVGHCYGRPEAFAFEPHVARTVFEALLRAEKITPRFDQRLASVTRDGRRISAIAMEDGTVYRAAMFIDATYEGDLMAMAGVSFTLGREGTNQYGESYNGIRETTPAHQFAIAVDPYHDPGQPASGLLPFIQFGDGGLAGAGDRRMQAYNFRLCFTQNPTNRLPNAVPPNYDPARYELLGRLLEASQVAGRKLNFDSFFNIERLPNGKVDINNNGPISTDFIGMNYTYPTNSYSARAEIGRAHLEYIQGLIHYLATSPRAPAGLRAEIQSWGPCRDEWPESGGYPRALYVREARRMVSDYVMIQADCQGGRQATDSICLGSYNMDSHNAQRVVQNGQVRNEGDVQIRVPQPYPIAYRSIVPREGECGNLLVTFALSASHTAFGSIRMEPVFMMLSQSAATAAALAINDRVPVQAVDYAKLARQLQTGGQMLIWSNNVAK